MKQFIAELIGTFILVFFACGTAVFAGAQVGVLGIALAFGLALIAAAYGIGAISGAHINPAVSLGAFVAGRLSARLPATGIIFREVQPDYDLDWHPAPRRQYIINLDAGVQITASDGEARVIGAGEVILVEDTTGKGHLSKAVDAKIRHCIFVPVD